LYFSWAFVNLLFIDFLVKNTLLPTKRHVCLHQTNYFKIDIYVAFGNYGSHQWHLMTDLSTTMTDINYYNH
jgi:hypothetical protein